MHTLHKYRQTGNLMPQQLVITSAYLLLGKQRFTNAHISELYIFKSFTWNEHASAFSWDSLYFNRSLICWIIYVLSAGRGWVGGYCWHTEKKQRKLLCCTLLLAVNAVLPFIGIHKIALVVWTILLTWPWDMDLTHKNTLRHTECSCTSCRYHKAPVSWKYAPVSRALAPIAAE